MKSQTAVYQLSDQDLLAAVKVAAGHERDATARLVALLAQLDKRRLYLGEGCSSLFAYCTQVLHLSEHAAYGRIEAARAARRFPMVLDLLTDGSVTLTAVTLLAPHLTMTNHCDVLSEARHRSKRDIEHLVARLQPRPPVPATMRKLPAPTLDERSVRLSAHDPIAKSDAAVVLSSLPRPRPATVTPLAPERYKVQFTVPPETHDKLRRAQDLLRHVISNSDPAVIFDRALTLLLADLDRVKLAATARPRAAKKISSGSRHIPAAVRREVWKRDEGQCAFVGTQGRCTERGFLEFHHVEPHSVGGTAVVEDVSLRCRAHNVYEAELYFGDRLPLLVREASPYGYGAVELGPDRAGRWPTPGDFWGRRQHLVAVAATTRAGDPLSRSVYSGDGSRTDACITHSSETIRAFDITADWRYAASVARPAEMCGSVYYQLGSPKRDWNGHFLVFGYSV